MQVRIHDNQINCDVEAELLQLTDQLNDRANETWVPEFHRRRQDRISDQDFPDWEWPTTENYLLEKNTVRDYAVLREDSVEGLMVLQEPEPSRLDSTAQVIYVRYLATAPWKRPGGTVLGRYRYIGTLLVAQAVRESNALGCDGRLGLHSLSGSDRFYRKLRFHEFGPDPGNRGLTYFELGPRSGGSNEVI